MQSKHWMSLATYLIAIALAFFVPVVSLCLIALVTVLWIVPAFGVEHWGERVRAPEQPR